MNEELRQILIEVARKRRFMFYGELAPSLNLDMNLDNNRVEIGRILGEISTYEHQQGRPLLTAIVVHKRDNRPGVGFFNLARELGLYCPGDNQEAFWTKEVNRVY